MEPVLPADILLEESLLPLQMTQCRLAKDIDVPSRRIGEIVHGKRALIPIRPAVDIPQHFKQLAGETSILDQNLIDLSLQGLLRFHHKLLSRKRKQEKC